MNQERNYPCDQPDRIPICVAPATVEKLRRLLFTKEFHAVGYTRFIELAIEHARQLVPYESVSNAYIGGDATLEVNRGNRRVYVWDKVRYTFQRTNDPEVVRQESPTWTLLKAEEVK